MVNFWNGDLWVSQIQFCLNFSLVYYTTPLMFWLRFISYRYHTSVTGVFLIELSGNSYQNRMIWRQAGVLEQLALICGTCTHKSQRTKTIDIFSNHTMSNCWSFQTLSWRIHKVNISWVFTEKASNLKPFLSFFSITLSALIYAHNWQA